MKKESILTLILVASLIFNFIQYSSNSTLEFIVADLGRNIVILHDTNTSFLEKINYREGLSERDIENCKDYETMVKRAIDWKPADKSSGGIYDVEILSSASFVNFAHARYTSWDIEYAHAYKQLIENCYKN